MIACPSHVGCHRVSSLKVSGLGVCPTDFIFLSLKLPPELVLVGVEMASADFGDRVGG